ncbi:hypothetical protein V8F06_003269 [Rhypophila decipiens]
MTSHDVRDVLNLPSDHSAGPRPAKKQKISGPRPNLKGLAREVQSLGGDNPIAIVPEEAVFKKRRIANRKPAARWELRGFTNSARGDDGALLLRHWRRKADPDPNHDAGQDGETQMTDGVVDGDKPPAEVIEDSAFAKYNVQVSVPQYSEEQYHSNLQNNDWTKEETDYLMQLVKDFDLRWPLIWDRYDYSPRPIDGEGVNGSEMAVVPARTPRTMEDLKARYYEVAAKMMAVQKAVQYMTGPEFQLYEIMQNFNAAQETARKEFALERMNRSKDEAREEESLLLEIKRILARTERFNEERRELYNRLDFQTTDSDITQFRGSAGLQSLLQNLMNVDKSKKRKSIMAPGEGPSPQSAVPGSAVSETAPNNRRESIAASVTGHRDSTAGTPATPVEPAAPAADKKKKGAQPVEKRNLSEQEKQIYGLSHHDRLGSGPTFRYEKINKLYSHKSGQQQMRITNALAELDIPPRLAMPTALVTQQFEKLWTNVTSLVDLRKVSDRLDADIKVEEAKKAERDKKNKPAGETTEKEKDGTEAEKGKDKAAEMGTKDGESSKDKEGEAAAGEEKAKAGGDANQGGDGAADDRAAPPAAADGAAGSPSKPKGGEADGDKDKEKEKEKTPRPGSSGGHKRSASVLSTISDKSSKRQKK